MRALCTVHSGEAEPGGVEVAVLNAGAVGDEERKNKARRNPWIGNKMRPKKPVKCTGRLYVLRFVQNSGLRKMVETLKLAQIHSFILQIF